MWVGYRDKHGISLLHFLDAKFTLQTPNTKDKRTDLNHCLGSVLLLLVIGTFLKKNMDSIKVSLWPAADSQVILTPLKRYKINTRRPHPLPLVILGIIYLSLEKKMTHFPEGCCFLYFVVKPPGTEYKYMLQPHMPFAYAPECHEALPDLQCGCCSGLANH